MSDSPLVGIGRQQASETAFEVVFPLAWAAVGWVTAKTVLGEAVPGAPLTGLEQNVLLGACIALTSWAMARQLYMFGKRSARTAVLWCLALAIAALLGLPYLVQSDFRSACAAAAGTVTESWDPAAEALGPVCQIGGVPGNAYLPGVLLRPAWDGAVSPWQWGGFLLVATVSALGLRTRRLRGTRAPRGVIEALRFAASAGSGAVLGDPAPRKGRVQACANATLWGEVCGQLYAAERGFAPGEWCQRCNQVFRPVDRELTFQVVTLFSGDVDVLNGLERVDTVSWRQGEAMPPDARLSGQERWVRIGSITVPDVLTVAQTLALVHEQLTTWQGSVEERSRPAAALAVGRASRIHAWIWQGSVSARLTYARPTASAHLAVGPVRLRDLALDTGEELTLQLDIGYLPVELRVGFRKTFLDESRPAEVQNSRQNLWVPVGPPAPLEETPGVWLPRVEGAALRTWLSTEQAHSESERGVTSPLPYRPDGPADAPAPRGPLDFVRMPLEGAEPPRIGASIAEWKWLEGEQIELLRRETIVLVEARR